MKSLDKKPLIAIDVDGVLNPFGSEKTLRPLGYGKHFYDGPGPEGGYFMGDVFVHVDHGRWLGNISQIVLNTELAWATSWGQLANDWFAPRLGLSPLTVIDVPSFGPRFGWSQKKTPIAEYAGDRPLAWIDDYFGGKEQGWAEDRRKAGSPTMIVEVEPNTGLTWTHVKRVIDWLEKL